MTLHPTSPEELKQWLRSTSQPFAIGRGESRYDLVDLSAMDKVLLYEAEEMVVQVQAGMLLANLNATLRGRSQAIPGLDEAHDGAVRTVGAALADVGPVSWEMHSPPLRTCVLGGRFMSTDGIEFRSGSRVVKSVAGYDIHRAFVGSRGMMGFITEVVLKTQLLPEVRRRFISNEAEISPRTRSLAKCIRLSAEEVLIEISGFEEDVDAALGEIERNIDLSPVTDREWHDRLILSAASSEGKNNPHELTLRLRRVFDPNLRLREKNG